MADRERLDDDVENPSGNNDLQEEPTPGPSKGETKEVKRMVLIRAVLGELLVTFLFLYIVEATGLNMYRSDIDNPVVGAVVTGFAGVALIYSFADVSGAHFNPAVTFATMVTKKTSLTKGLLYIAAQIIGSIFAGLWLLCTFPDSIPILGKVVAITPPSGVAPIYALLMEFILTYILIYVIFAVAFDTVDTSNVEVLKQTAEGVKKYSARNLTIFTTTGQSKAGFAPIAIGFTLGFLCLIGGSVSGGCFNPARAFGIALVSNTWEGHWIFWIGDFGGAAAAGLTQAFFSHLKKKTIAND
eukprot:TRINITY_DN2805_c0_g1_i1.p1 TRINITY_DN2805_c0_g1~~TRINITY_DN2805_c0_g1_i1.p1  ORF type:complete len:299 (-),score=146.76 TRINITY_DN2805_c0_g1_i1:45-941(-)